MNGRRERGFDDWMARLHFGRNRTMLRKVTFYTINRKYHASFFVRVGTLLGALWHTPQAKLRITEQDSTKLRLGECILSEIRSNTWENTWESSELLDASSISTTVNALRNQPRISQGWKTGNFADIVLALHGRSGELIFQHYGPFGKRRQAFNVVPVTSDESSPSTSNDIHVSRNKTHRLIFSEIPEPSLLTLPSPVFDEIIQLTNGPFPPRAIEITSPLTQPALPCGLRACKI